MSMRTYVVYSSAAFLIDEEIAAYYCLFKDRQDGTIPPEIQALSPEEFQKMAREGTLPCGYSDVDLMDITDAIEMSVVSDFDGDVGTLSRIKRMRPWRRAIPRPILATLWRIGSSVTSEQRMALLKSSWRSSKRS